MFGFWTLTVCQTILRPILYCAIFCINFWVFVFLHFTLLTWGGFHKPIYALRKALTLCAKLLHPEKASQKFGAEHKMALRPTFSLYEIDPWLQKNL